MTATTTAPTQRPGFWLQLWRFLQAASMSSGEYQEDRIDALERRVAELQRQVRDQAPSP